MHRLAWCGYKSQKLKNESLNVVASPADNNRADEVPDTPTLDNFPAHYSSESAGCGKQVTQRE